MKKIMLITFTLFSISVFSQTDYIDSKHATIGVDLGYSQNGYLPMSFYMGIERAQYGFSLGYPINSGQKGKHYSTVNWDEFPDDIIESGHFYYPFTFDVGYNVFKNLVIGGSLGYAMKVLYRNMYDDLHVLGVNGSYHITTSNGGEIEYKAYISCYFPPSSDFGSFYVKGFYSKIMGAGATVGMAF